MVVARSSPIGAIAYSETVSTSIDNVVAVLTWVGISAWLTTIVVADDVEHRSRAL